MKLWSGRFTGRLHPLAESFASSLAVDRRLYREDIKGSIAHAGMLARQHIISQKDARAISTALRQIRDEIDRGKLKLPPASPKQNRFVADDIHMAIEQRLIEKIGFLGGKLHTARSRNDQVALDERLFLRKKGRHIVREIRRLQQSLVAKAERYNTVVMPGYTHLQRAQPILLAHHLLAYVSMLDRDAERFEGNLKRINQSPLGAAALAGTSFPIDRRTAARALGFVALVDNSIDAVSDRDVQIEFLAHCAITMMHLSRLAEELVLWSSQEFAFVDLGDAFSTGSSIMPQKKNPDIAELVRGKTGRVYGNLVALLTVMKGLPLAYNRDMQEDKLPLFDSADTLQSCLSITSMMVGGARFHRDRFESELQTDFLIATDITDYLVGKGVSFRLAHGMVGKLVQFCITSNRSLQDLTFKEFRRFAPVVGPDIRGHLNLHASLSGKASFGSTSPREVNAALRRWKRRLKNARQK
jgi:argininosuccinate lyase